MRRKGNTRTKGPGKSLRRAEKAAVAAVALTIRAGLAAALVVLCLAGGSAALAQFGPDPAAAPLAVQNPRRIAGGPDGLVLVTDRRHNAVVAVDRDSLEPVWSARLPDGSAPFGIAVFNRLAFVGDTGTQTVGVYRIVRSGRIHRFAGSRGTGTRLDFAYELGQTRGGVARRFGFGTNKPPAAIAKAIGIAVDGGQKLVFVLDGAAKTVAVFGTNGAFVRSFEPRDSDGALLSPVSLAVDTLRQEILVSDYGDPRPIPDCNFCMYTAAAPARILIYDYDGELLFEIRGDGSTHPSARFARLQGMAASADGRIFAADPLGSRILVFDRYSGALLDELGTQGPAEGQLMLPLDVWLDSETGDLFVSNNRGARRVEVLRGAGGLP